MNIEQELSKLHPRGPGENLAQRMDNLFDGATPSSAPWYRRPVALWQLAFACALLVVAGFYAGRSTPKDAPPAQERTVTVYYIGGADTLKALNSQSRTGFLLGPDPPEIRVESALVVNKDGTDAT
ncbi:MAG: hypothetical protein AAB353_01230 [Candidatus Hydrogenedentota bacterium]